MQITAFPITLCGLVGEREDILLFMDELKAAWLVRGQEWEEGEYEGYLSLKARLARVETLIKDYENNTNLQEGFTSGLDFSQYSTTETLSEVRIDGRVLAVAGAGQTQAVAHPAHCHWCNRRLC